MSFHLSGHPNSFLLSGILSYSDRDHRTPSLSLGNPRGCGRVNLKTRVGVSRGRQSSGLRPVLREGKREERGRGGRDKERLQGIV